MSQEGVSAAGDPKATALGGLGGGLAQARQLKRYWWIIVLVTLIAVAAAAYASIATPTTYTGRSSLILSSSNLSPDQDAVLVQGYVDYFNDPAFQAQLIDQAGIDAPVSLSARAAAASPIMLIEATAADPEAAQASAAEVAEGFQTAINFVRNQEQERQIEMLEERIDAAAAEESVGSQTAIQTLEGQIAEVERDRADGLQELQFEGGVATNAPNTVNNIILGAAGGLLVGILTALAFAASRGSRRAEPQG